MVRISSLFSAPFHHWSVHVVRSLQFRTCFIYEDGTKLRIDIEKDDEVALSISFDDIKLSTYQAVKMRSDINVVSQLNDLGVPNSMRVKFYNWLQLRLGLRCSDFSRMSDANHISKWRYFRDRTLSRWSLNFKSSLLVQHASKREHTV